jgi:(E)-4-hydroxy-3-methylbut-2-enyl-diphosphate synthase
MDFQNKYCESLTSYKRRLSREVMIGNTALGGHNPIRVQSMTTVDTMDTMGSVDQVLRMVDSGCEYVRITAPTIKDAKNLEHIKTELRNRNCHVPLVADIHFTPNAAEIAAQIVEKVRINPGNYADRKKFQEIDYSDAEYLSELNRIEDKFSPLVELCRQHGTAMRIGTNHGSLSDRIMSRYGDTPLGMVESALEFIRICEKLDFKDIVVSMKSSNPQVMVQAYRMLVKNLDEEGLEPYPLHLGVTEAGEAEDGRIKSSVGIGTLLEDGIGDTVRVSLTEDPEVEAPVAKVMVDRLNRKQQQRPIPEAESWPINAFEYHRRESRDVTNFGKDNVPRVISDFSKLKEVKTKDLVSIGHIYMPVIDKWNMTDLGTDYVYSGSNPIDFMLPNGLREILDSELWARDRDPNKHPYFKDVPKASDTHPELNFIEVNCDQPYGSLLDELKDQSPFVLVLVSDNAHRTASVRRFSVEMMNRDLHLPVVLKFNYPSLSEDEQMIYAATDAGTLLIDGIGDGLMVSPSFEPSASYLKRSNDISFGILQAARTRITKTEYISCPSCGRTLFDLQETTAMIRKRTDHLKGLKIGIMGCIVNGPGEMADADFGYVGSARGKITLYKGQEVVKRGVPSERALDELIELIRENGRWIEPELVNA